MPSSKVEFVLVLAFLFLISLPHSVSAQVPDPSSVLAPAQTCPAVCLTIRAANGQPVSAATVWVRGSGPEGADLNGRVTIEQDSDMSTPQQATVTAPGYKTRIAMLDSTDCTPEVVLESDTSSSRSYGRTVSSKELDPGRKRKAEALQQQAVKEIDRGDYAAAERTLKQALVLNPSAAEIYNNLGILFVHNRDLDRAAQSFEKAANIAPYNPLITANLGLMRWLQRRFDESYQLLSRAEVHGFATDQSHYILGVLALQKAHPVEAAGQLSKVNSRKFPFRDLFLSIALRNVGKSRAASKHFESFLRRHPVPPMTQSPNR